ncbi:MAG: Stk1 family PASTA domain-containing Ser/Thr kinase [Lachnospira sp.]
MLRSGMFIADRYEIIEQIGTGGMADVYKAKCHKLNRYVAIKVLKSEFSEDKNFVFNFRAEAQSAAGLTHANIVNVYDVGDENGIYYIVMELVEGITLKKYIEKRGKIPYKEAVSIAIQIANGMDAAHKHHIIHRDIKPQNIIISKEGKVKVTDFGIAKAASTGTITSSSAMGSVHYISPEQARGGYSDEKSDIYSLGVTIFEMLTGVVPFDGDTAVSVAVRHIQDQIPAPSELVNDIPISIDKIVLKCTQKRREQRYQSAAELIADLKKALVSPDEDFVKLPYPYVNAAASQAGDGVANDSVQRAGMFTPINEDEEDDLGISEDEIGYSENMDVDDEGSDKLDLIIKIIGIGICVVILIITIFIIASLLNSGKSNKPSEETTKTEEVTTEDPNLVVMPDVTGLTKEEAIAALNAKGLGYDVKSENSDKVAANVVIRQETVAGAKIKKNSQPVIVISLGEDVNTVDIPDVVNKSEDAARTALEKLGFVVNVEYDYSDKYAAYKVISYTPTGVAKKGDTITIVVSRGAEEKEVTMIKLIGKTESEARRWLDENGLKIKVNYETSSKKPYGTVSAVDYPEKSIVKTGMTITIQVSHYTEPETKPTEPETPKEPESSSEDNTQSSSESNSEGNSEGNSEASGESTSAPAAS